MIEGDVFETIVPLVVAGEENKGQLKGSDCTTKCTLTERAILKYLATHAEATQKEIALAVGKSERTAKTATAHLREMGLLQREGAKKNGHWVVMANRDTNEE